MDANIKTPQDALEWLDRSIREEAELDGEMSNEHAIQLAFIQNMLAKFPRRNCDVGTAEEQCSRLWSYCAETRCGDTLCRNGNCSFEDIRMCALRWAQMTYEEGGAR